MKKLLIVAVVFSAAMVSCKSSKKLSSFTEIDSLSYAIGIDYGTHAKRLDSTVNVSVIAAAIQDVLNNNPQMDQEAAYGFLNEYFTVRKPAREKAKATAFFEELKKKNPNIKSLQVGPDELLYEVIDEGDMSQRATNDEDQVLVNYKGVLADGKVFDQNDSIKFALNRVIKGWTEGLKLVGKGGKVTLWVPAELGYGERGSGDMIPGNAALVFDVDLLDVIPAGQAE